MRTRHPAYVLLPILAAFLTALLAIGLFVVHPPPLGWLGFGLLALALTVASAVLLRLLLGRGAEEPIHRHPRSGRIHRLLVVLDADFDPVELRSAILLRGVARRLVVRLVAPVVPSSPLRFLSGDEESEQRAAHARIRAARLALAGAGIHAEGRVGPDDPLQAAADVLVGWTADEILLVAPLESQRTWLDRGLERALRDASGLPVATLFGRAGTSETSGAVAVGRR